MKTCPQCRNTFTDANAFCPRDGTALVVSDSLASGTVFRNKFQIQEEIGRGGMGVVYRARHILLEYDRALKLIHTRFSGDVQATRRFVSEAILANQIDHPNVVRVHDVDDTEEGQPYIIMEYVSGKSLRRVLRPDPDKESVPLSPVRAVAIACQICDALTAAHRKRIIHRDMKPDNILIMEQPGGGELVKVVDFGLGKAIRELQEPHPTETTMTTQTAVFVGTPQYCSPEMVMGDDFHPLDHRTDIYSLGIVLYEMLTGQVPFSGPMREVLEKQVVTAPAPMESRRSGLSIPKDLSDVVMKALSKEPEARFESAEAMKLALQRLESAPAPPTSPASRPANLQASGVLAGFRSRWSALKLAFTAGIVIGALLMIAIGLALYLSPRPLGGPASLASSTQIKLDRAKHAFEGGSYEEAIGLYRDILASDGSNKEARDGLSLAESARTAEEEVFGKAGRR